ATASLDDARKPQWGDSLVLWIDGRTGRRHQPSASLSDMKQFGSDMKQFSLHEIQGSLRVSIFLHDLSATGVSRNAVAIANACAATGMDVTLLVADGDGAFAGSV